MGRPAIRAEGLGKQFHLAGRRERYRTLRSALSEAALGPFRAVGALAAGRFRAGSSRTVLHALRNVSFRVDPGEVVGIIGHNGAGKSTLLKILSRITEPTEGYAEILGRVGSLLEVGTGFHPELSGRENIFLNGAILGMRRAEIARQFDAIVAFAEVEPFVDTPVKHYSSGMYLRLAFAVAAHLETEVLLVDEVLAVGDAAFQNKCVGKMGDVAREGRTVLFVSHSMPAIQMLCPRSILIRQGHVALDAPTDDVIRDYLAYLTSGAEQAFDLNPERRGSGGVRLTQARILDEHCQSVRHLVSGRTASIVFDYENLAGASRFELAATVYNHHGTAVTRFDTRLANQVETGWAKEGRLVCEVPVMPLPIGQYRLDAEITVNGEMADHIPNALVFDVESSTFFDSGRTPSLRECACMVSHRWRAHDTGCHPGGTGAGQQEAS